MKLVKCLSAQPVGQGGEMDKFGISVLIGVGIADGLVLAFLMGLVVGKILFGAW